MAPHFLLKPTGARCNLDCAYCYYLQKEDLTPDSSFRMSDAVLEATFRALIAATPGDTVTVAWQGGEPTLMGVDFFRRADRLIRELLPAGKRVEYTIQTNGVLVDDEFAALFAELGYLVGVSIDGPQVLHDAFRVDPAGHGTFERAARGIDRLQAHGAAWNVLTSVHAANGDHGRTVYRFLRDELGARYVQLIPVVERVGPDGRTGSPVGDTAGARSVRPEQWGRFLIEVFEEWVARDVGEVFVVNFDWSLAAWVGWESPVCIFKETCGDALVLEHTGDLYSCDHFVEPEHRLGNVTQVSLGRLAGSERQRAFGAAKETTLPRQCRECEFRFACHGECPKNRFARAADGEAGLNYLCAGYLAYFRRIDPVMREMAALVRRGLPAALAGGADRPGGA